MPNASPMPASPARQAPAHPLPVREAERKAMRRVLDERGFEHAVGSIADAVAVTLVPQHGFDVDEKMGRVADRAEAAVLDALVVFARQHGWRARR